MSKPSTPEKSVISDIAFYETSPDSLTWHKIWDHEIDRIVNISRPVSLSVATTSLGVALGLIPTGLAALGAAQAEHGFGVDDAVVLLLWAATLTLGLTVGWFALLGQKDARGVVKTIRDRAKRQL